ncbi:MAG TPA: ATP-binding protein [Actinomycetota bacterium]|nr:ATP-binding protein [Actinomycetota bacterium]
MTDIRKELPADPSAAALAREMLDGWLTADVGERAANDVRLATTELISNALRHGGLGPDDLIVLSGSIDDVADVVTIFVEQRTAITRATVQPMRPATESGMGLRIVESVANRWGVHQGPPGVVWFEVDR